MPRDGEPTRSHGACERERDRKRTDKSSSLQREQEQCDIDANGLQRQDEGQRFGVGGENG